MNSKKVILYFKKKKKNTRSVNKSKFSHVATFGMNRRGTKVVIKT